MARAYTYYNGKRNIGGTAALLHKVKLDGGLLNHYVSVFEKMAEAAIEEGVIEMKEPTPALRLIKGGREKSA